MAPVTVEDLAGDAGSRAAPDTLVTIRLVASLDGSLPGHTADGARTILKSYRPVVAEDGSWSAELEPNANLTPAGTVYEVVRQAKGVRETKETISVPNTGPGPFKAALIVVDPPGELPTAALTTAIATLEAADLADRAAASTALSDAVSTLEAADDGVLEQANAYTDLAALGDMSATSVGSPGSDTTGVFVTYQTVWGIQGVDAYFDVSGAVDGEGAVFSVDGDGPYLALIGV